MKNDCVCFRVLLDGKGTLREIYDCFGVTPQAGSGHVLNCSLGFLPYEDFSIVSPIIVIFLPSGKSSFVEGGPMKILLQRFVRACVFIAGRSLYFA